MNSSRLLSHCLTNHEPPLKSLVRIRGCAGRQVGFLQDRGFFSLSLSPSVFLEGRRGPERMEVVYHEHLKECVEKKEKNKTRNKNKDNEMLCLFFAAALKP